MIRRFVPDPRGQAMVEFGLVIITVVLLMVGIFDLGRVVFASNDTSHAARDAARQASVSPLDCETIYHVVQRQTLGQSAVTVSVDYRREPSATMQNPAWTLGLCPIYNPATAYDDDPTTGTSSVAVAPRVGGEIRVVVQNNIAIATPLISNIVGGSIPISGTSSMVVTFVPS